MIYHSKYNRDNKHIYPFVRSEVFYNEESKRFMLVMETSLRKKHTDGFYYLWRFYKEVIVGKGEELENTVLIAINHFHAQVYTASIIGKIDTKLINPLTDDKLFIRDDDQQKESERLLKWEKLEK